MNRPNQLSGRAGSQNLVVYGSEYSYFTGKFEAYLRFKEIPYRRRPMGVYEYLWRIPRLIGAAQLPTVELPDGRWMTDSTPMIAWLETQYPAPAVIPADPVQRFIALLTEDFGDEWLWRPAMHYRWSHTPDRRLLSRALASELVRLPVPLFLRSRWLARRQMRLFVRGDGVERRTRPHMDATYLRTLDLLEPVLTVRPFLLGERPTVADYGLLGPMFRHFSLDPTPAQLMRDRAPAVYEWVARVWNARAARLGSRELVSGIPGDLEPLLRESGETHLEMLAANAAAHERGERRHDFTVQGVSYRGVPTSPYRVWALERLRAAYLDLEAGPRARVERLLQSTGCWEPIWRLDALNSGHDPGGQAPFARASRMVRD